MSETTTNASASESTPTGPATNAAPVPNDGAPADGVADITDSAAPIDGQADAASPGATDGPDGDGASHHRANFVDEDQYLASLDADEPAEDDTDTGVTDAVLPPSEPAGDPAYAAAIEGLKALNVSPAVLEGLDPAAAVAWFDSVSPTLAANQTLNAEAAAPAPEPAPAPVIPEVEAAAIQAIAETWGEDIAAPMKTLATQNAAFKGEMAGLKQANTALRNELDFLRNHVEAMVIKSEVQRLSTDFPGLSDPKRVEAVTAEASKLLAAGIATSIDDAMTRAATAQFANQTLKQRQQQAIASNRQRDRGQPGTPTRNASSTQHHPTPAALEDAALAAIDAGATRAEIQRTMTRANRGL